MDSVHILNIDWLAPETKGKHSFRIVKVSLQYTRNKTNQLAVNGKAGDENGKYSLKGCMAGRVFDMSFGIDQIQAD